MFFYLKDINIDIADLVLTIFIHIYLRNSSQIHTLLRKTQQYFKFYTWTILDLPQKLLYRGNFKIVHAKNVIR